MKLLSIHENRSTIPSLFYLRFTRSGEDSISVLAGPWKDRGEAEKKKKEILEHSEGFRGI